MARGPRFTEFCSKLSGCLIPAGSYPSMAARYHGGRAGWPQTQGPGKGFLLYQHLRANRNELSAYHPTSFERNAGTDFAWCLQWPLNSIQDTKMPGVGSALSWFRQLCFLLFLATLGLSWSYGSFPLGVLGSLSSCGPWAQLLHGMGAS